MTEVSARSPAEALVTKLSAIQVFSDLPQDDLLWFVAQCKEHRAVAGDIIIREGAAADSIPRAAEKSQVCFLSRA